MSNDASNLTPPTDLPTDPALFDRLGDDAESILDAAGDQPSALQRLGAPPFARSKFPFIGFLASVYEHLASHARGRSDRAG